MSKKIRKTILCTAILTFGVLMGSGAVQAATLKTLCDYSRTPSTHSIDLNGDGKKDSVKISYGFDSKNSGRINRVKVHLNKKPVLNVSAVGALGVDVQYMRLSKNKEFLYLCGYGDSHMPSISSVYRYDRSKKKMVKVLFLKERGRIGGTVDKVSSNSIRFTNSCMPNLTGRVKWQYTYIYRNGEFRLKSASAPAYSIIGIINLGDGYEKYFKKNQFVADQPMTFYTTPKRTKKAFTISSGKVVKLKKMTIGPDQRIYFQFQYGRKTGWISEDSGQFRGVMRRCAGGFFG